MSAKQLKNPCKFPSGHRHTRAMGCSPLVKCSCGEFVLACVCPHFCSCHMSGAETSIRVNGVWLGGDCLLAQHGFFCLIICGLRSQSLGHRPYQMTYVLSCPALPCPSNCSPLYTSLSEMPECSDSLVSVAGQLACSWLTILTALLSTLFLLLALSLQTY